MRTYLLIAALCTFGVPAPGAEPVPATRGALPGDPDGTAVAPNAGVEQPALKRGVISVAYPSLSSSALSSATLADLPQGVVLQSPSLTVTAKEMDEELQRAPAAMRKALAANRFFLLEMKATKKLIVAVAKESKGWKSVTPEKEDQNAGPAEDADDAMIEAYFAVLTKDLTVSPDELKAFYDANKDLCGGEPFTAMKEQLARYVLGEKKQQFAEAHIRALGERMKVRVDRKWTATQAALACDNPVDAARASGKASMVDFGAHGCRACDMMTPILADMEKKHAGMANVLFVPVREEQVLASRYGIQSIPVQIFFDASGTEIYRHRGYLPQTECEAWLAKAKGK